MNPYPAWTVLEIQGTASTRASLSTVFADPDEAMAAFFQVCAAAARSELLYHAVCLIPPEPPIGKQVTRWEIWDRREIGNG